MAIKTYALYGLVEKFALKINLNVDFLYRKNTFLAHSSLKVNSILFNIILYYIDIHN